MEKIFRGFIPPVITSDNYVLGQKKLPEIVLQKNGNWIDFLPPGERQAYGFETYGCWIYNTLQIIEALDRRVFLEQTDYSERGVYIGLNAAPPGGNPHVSAEWIRNNGLFPESLLPFGENIKTLEEYRSPNPLLQELIAEGLKWLTTKSYGHEWVFNAGSVKEKHERLKHALRLSPLGVSVVAWKENNVIYVKDQGEPDNHWTNLVAYDGIYPVILDSYPPFIKRLSPDYDFGFAKRFSLEKVSVDIPKEKQEKQLLITNLKNLLCKTVCAGSY